MLNIPCLGLNYAKQVIVASTESHRKSSMNIFFVILSVKYDNVYLFCTRQKTLIKVKPMGIGLFFLALIA